MNFRHITSAGKLIALIAVISLASCKKDSTATNSNDTNAANLSDSSTAADNAYYDVLNNAFVGFSDNASIWSVSGPHSGKTGTNSTQELGTGNLGCANYTVDNNVPGEYPKTLVLDFGTGCTSSDGIVRSGKITYVFTEPLISPGATATVTLENYVVNGYGVQGAYTITNNYSETVGISFITHVTNGIVTYPSGTNFHYSHNKTYIQTAGSNTPFDITDDVYSLSGNSSFSSSEGNSLVLTASPNTPLVRAVICHNISQGILSFVYNQKVEGTIDFGNGECDNQASLTIGNLHKTITLK